jgi:hypothetical protein
MKIFSTVFLAFILIFSLSCKKEEEETVDKCQNGFLDTGEEGIDCGGTCTECEESYFAFLIANIKGAEISFPTKTLTYENSIWSLSFSNDSIVIQLNLGSNGEIGSYPISPIGTSGSYNDTTYSSSANGEHAINDHSETDRRMSGFFSVNLFVSGTTDTLRITGGQYEDLPY